MHGLCSLQHVGSVVEARGFSCPVPCGILVPQPGIEPESLALEGGFLTTGPPGKSPEFAVLIYHNLLKQGRKISPTCLLSLSTFVCLCISFVSYTMQRHIRLYMKSDHGATFKQENPIRRFKWTI